MGCRRGFTRIGSQGAIGESKTTVSSAAIAITMSDLQAPSLVLENARKSIHAWQDRIRDPSLTVLLILELAAIFLATPLAAEGLPMARAITDSLVLGVLGIVVMLSHRPGAIILILLGLAVIAASFLYGGEWSPVSAPVLRREGDILVFCALIWVIAHAVYAGGPITSYRLQGAVVLYLTLATVFAAAYGLIWELNPSAFVHLLAPVGSPKEVATMLYFSLTTLTTAGYGDIVAVDPFARSLANLEAMMGQFYFAITVTRLVTLQLANRRR
jgi:hypothetical protein